MYIDGWDMIDEQEDGPSLMSKKNQSDVRRSVHSTPSAHHLDHNNAFPRPPPFHQYPKDGKLLYELDQ